MALCVGLSIHVLFVRVEVRVGTGAASLSIGTAMVPSLHLVLLYLQRGAFFFFLLLLLCFLLLVIAIDTDFRCQS